MGTMKTGQEASQGRRFLVGRGVKGKRGGHALWHGHGQGHGLGSLQLFSLLCPEKEKAKQTPSKLHALDKGSASPRQLQQHLLTSSPGCASGAGTLPLL